MIGREPPIENDLFFLCSLIEWIGRQTRNRRRDVIDTLGEAELRSCLDLADVLHCEPLENTANELIEKHNITAGAFDNVALCQYRVPTHFDIGKVYKRLIVAVARETGIDLIAVLLLVYHSWIAEKIDDYNCSMFFENPDYLFKSYLAGYALE